MNSNEILRSERGFTLVQVLVFIGLSAIVSIGLANLFALTSAVQMRAQVDSEIVQVMSDLRMTLVRSQACRETWVGAKLPTEGPPTIDAKPANLEFILDENGQRLISLGPTPNGTLNIKSIQLTMNPSTPKWLKDSLLSLDLWVEIQPNTKLPLGTNQWRRKMTMTFETGSKGELISCNSLSTEERVHFEGTLCTAMGGQMRNQVCDLSKSANVAQAACKMVGLSSNGTRCK